MTNGGLVLEPNWGLLALLKGIAWNGSLFNKEIGDILKSTLAHLILIIA